MNMEIFGALAPLDTKKRRPAVNRTASKSNAITTTTTVISNSSSNVQAGKRFVPHDGPQQDFCRWCARPIHGKPTELLRFFCRAECVQSMAWFAASKKGLSTAHYREAVKGSRRGQISVAPVTLRECA